MIHCQLWSTYDSFIGFPVRFKFAKLGALNMQQTIYNDVVNQFEEKPKHIKNTSQTVYNVGLRNFIFTS